MKKRVFTLILAMMIAAISLVASVQVFAVTENPATAIKGHNLALQDNVYIMYYVDFAGVPKGSETGVLVWTSEQENYTYGAEKAKAIYDGTSEGYEVYYFTGVSAKMMSQDIYAVSYIKDGDTITYSELDKYSVLQYCYNKKDSTTIMGEGGTTLGKLVAGLLDYGTLAQTFFRYNLDRLANAEYYQIKVKYGTLADGTQSGLFQNGEQVTLSALVEKDGIPFSCWKDETGATVGTERNIQVKVGAKNKTYTATYIQTSVGLEFESNEDGTCALIGMGDCNDTDVIIPDRSPEGDLVTSIEGSAFNGEEITSITIPVGIEEIGRNAFKGCTELTDIYYAGTTAQWEEIDIKSGNAPLTNATLHTNDVIYTVTFVDYDGSQIKVEQVVEGESATAPADPEREGHTFTGWDKSFANVTADITVTATYELTVSDPTIILDKVTAQAGESVDVKLTIRNNPGMAASTFKINYDSSTLTLNGVEFNTQFGGDFDEIGSLNTPVSVSWSSMTDINNSAVFLTLNFSINDHAPTNSESSVSVIYNVGDFCNINEEDIVFTVIDGSVTVK